MEISLNNFENLFFIKYVPISIKDGSPNQTRKLHLSLKVEWIGALSERLYSRKVLTISLTDNKDPFFLYNLHLSEEEFQTLKTSQDLPIDFSAFPHYIIDKIGKCLLEEKNPHPRFFAVLELGNSVSSRFDIMENNEHKMMTHISLFFVAATVSEVRLKEENQYLQKKLKDQSASYHHTLNSKEQELVSIKRRFQELTEKDNRHAVELQEERKQLLLRRSKAFVDRRYREIIEDKEKIILELKNSFSKKENDFVAEINSLKIKVSDLEEEVWKNMFSYLNRQRTDNLNFSSANGLCISSSKDSIWSWSQTHLHEIRSSDPPRASNKTAPKAVSHTEETQAGGNRNEEIVMSPEDKRRVLRRKEKVDYKEPSLVKRLTRRS